MRVERIGQATLHLGDCREVMASWPPCFSVSAVITDPPYGVGADSAAFQNARKRGSAAAPSKDYGAANWDAAAPEQPLLNQLAARGKWCIFWGGNYFRFDPSACWLVWDKDNGDNGYADCELAWTNLPRAVRKFRWRWMGMLQELAGQKKEERVHPTQKPVQLLEWCIQLCPDSNTILDPFMGSGTTGVACVNLGKQFIGVEINEQYFETACQRIENAYRQGRLIA